VLTGSLVDLTVELVKPATAQAINDVFAFWSTGDLEGILSLTGEPLVSSDVIRSPYSAVVDAALTTVSGGTQAKVVAWYDNEWSYATRLVELAYRIAVRTPVLA
jgi:glyceraldehyde 3-phosphate dehydrogenase